ncbi:MAG: putative multi-sensor signal transduction histidine kinase [Acidimicrobiales bacterium]|jgi:HPt (histidine-containing phosphotransfer) domain-containing protein|nr:putative multi-sensor signal transduction histidine kinase [Acidimicrobiales bacterium]
MGPGRQTSGTAAVRCRGTVLVVDENPENRRAVRGSLEALGWLVDEAADGPQAIDAAVARDYAAVFMDRESSGIAGLRAAGSTARVIGRTTVDPARLALLATSRSGRDLVAELVDLFVRSAPSRAGALRDAAGLADRDALRFVAHNLRGSAGNLGADALREACTHLENAAVAGRWADARALVDTVVAELEAARDALLVLAVS